MSHSLFLGRTARDAALAPASRVELDPDRLTRHGVCIGMTGSGKTGLSVSLIEELVLAGVPVLCLDPKGDLANLALLFPELRGSDFAPWVDDAEARRQDLSVEQLGAKTAETWRDGLASWDIAPERLAALRDRIDLRIYTPGSEAGRPVNVLAALSCPSTQVLDDGDGRRELIAGTVSSLLSLVGVQADPVRSPEHLVLSQIVDLAWSAGEDLDMEALILRLVDPPFQKVGVFPLDRFWSPDDRMDLAMKLNAVVAAPSFAPWTLGDNVEPASLFDTRSGRVPVSVFYLAHLSDSERMFFSALLLERVVAWSRAQPGTSSLRGLVFLDEAFGYLPPHPANPPTKRPLLTLMKQARAVGLGVLLSTQNPVDLDYKALTNAGTWFLGRLSTRQDVERVSEGLRAANAGGEDVTEAIASLAPREFLLREVTNPTPVRFRTRWAMSFLRGPITRHELGRLSGPIIGKGRHDAAGARDPAGPGSSRSTRAPGPDVSRAPGPDVSAARPPNDRTLSAPPPAPKGAWMGFLDPRTAFAARLDGVFERTAGPARADGAIEFAPALYAEASLRFDEERAGFVLDEHHHLVWFPLDGARRPEAPLRIALHPDDISSTAPAGARFRPLPDWLDEADELAQARREVLDAILRKESRGLWVCAPLKLHGTAAETLDEFEARCHAVIEERVDAELAKLSASYTRKIDRIEETIRKKERDLTTLAGRHQADKAQEVVNAGELLLSFFVGRKKSVGSVLSRRKTSAATASRIEGAEGDLEALRAQLAAIERELDDLSESTRDEQSALLKTIEERAVGLEKGDIALREFGILWVPVTRRL